MSGRRAEKVTVDKQTIYIAGDSTSASCPEQEAPMAGWGQLFHTFFMNTIRIRNEAMGGRSSNSFIEEGRLQAILEQIQPDDYLFIQFGHNDQKSYGTEPYTSYQEHLSHYILGAREKKAIPILLTSVQRRKFSADGKIENTLGDYPDAMRQLAARLDVPLIDMSAKTKELYERLGIEDSKRLFTILLPNVHHNYPDGIEDNTHFSEVGALEIGKLVIEGMKELQLPVVSHLKQ